MKTAWDEINYLCQKKLSNKQPKEEGTFSTQNLDPRTHNEKARSKNNA